MAMRIVRCAVVSIRDAVAVAIAIGAVGDAIGVTVAVRAILDKALSVPAAALEDPAAVALFPAVRMPVVAAAIAFVVALGPHVVVAAPVPVSRDPYVSRAPRGNHLVTRGGRRDVHMEPHVGRGRKGKDADRSGGQRSEKQFTFPHEVLYSGKE